MQLTQCQFKSCEKTATNKHLKWGRRLMDARYKSPLARMDTVTAVTLPPNAYQNVRHVKLHARPAATFVQTKLVRSSRLKPLTPQNNGGAGKLLVPMAWAEPGTDANRFRGWLKSPDIVRFTTRPSSSGEKFAPMMVFRRPAHPSFFNPFRLAVLVTLEEKTLNLPNNPGVLMTFTASGAAWGALGLPYFVEGNNLAKVANAAAHIATMGLGGISPIVQNIAPDIQGEWHHSDWDKGSYRLIDGAYTDNIGVAFSIANMQKNNKEKMLRQIGVESGESALQATDFECYFNSGKFRNEFIPLSGLPKLKKQPAPLRMASEIYNQPSARIFKQAYRDVQWERVKLIDHRGNQLGWFDWWRGAVDTLENKWYGVRAGSKVDVFFIKRQTDYASDPKVSIIIATSKQERVYTKVGTLEEKAMAPIFAAYKTCINKFGDMACMKDHLKSHK